MHHTAFTDLMQFSSLHTHTHTHKHLSVNVRHPRIHLQCLFEAGALYYPEHVNVHEAVPTFSWKRWKANISVSLPFFAICGVRLGQLCCLFNTTTQQ